LDELSVWGKELSVAEVDEIFNGGKPADLSKHPAYGSCAHWWRMGDGDTYDIITDHKGGDDATMINMAPSNFVLDVP